MDLSALSSLLPPQWRSDLAKINQNDFQSIRKLAFSQTTTTTTSTTTTTKPELPKFMKSQSAMKVEEKDKSSSSTPKTLGRFVHFLRCSLCGLESINKSRFDSHLPCCQTACGDHFYCLHTCSACFACSTSQSLMDEHIDLFHKGSRVSLLCLESMTGSSCFIKHC